MNNPINYLASDAVKASVNALEFNLSEWDKNPRIGGLLSKTVLAGGKKLRPLMTFIMGDLFKIPHKEITPFGTAVEMVHASTLAHDDVIDGADTRRGQPSINAVSSNKQAVLAGDYLLAHVLSEVAKSGRNDVVVELAAVISDLAEGEWLQIDNAKNENLNIEDINRVASKKTGSVIRWCCVTPALIADQTSAIVEKCRQLGESIGVAFQKSDDILDYKRNDGSEFADAKNGVVSSVSFYLLSNRTTPENQKISSSNLKSQTFSQEEIDQAISQVREEVNANLNHGNEIVSYLEDQLAPLNESQQNAINSLRTIIGYLAVRI